MKTQAKNQKKAHADKNLIEKQFDRIFDSHLTTTLKYGFCIFISQALISCGPNNLNSNSHSSPFVTVAGDLASDGDAANNNGIVNGTPVSVLDTIAQSTVSIMNDEQILCTGTLISTSIVITAAHCNLSNPSNNYYVGFSIEVPNGSNEVQKRKVLKQIIHPRFAALTPKEMANENLKDLNDVSLVLFEGAAPANYQPVWLLQDPRYLFKGQQLTVAGYGLTKGFPKIEYANSLMKANFTIASTDYARTEFVIFDNSGKATCRGDSGGSAYLNYKGRMILAAVTSRSLTAKTANTCNGGSVHSSIPGNLAFINFAVKQLNEFKATYTENIFSLLQ